MNILKTISKVAEIEMVYKTTVKASERPKVSRSEEVYHLFMQTWDENKLEFVEEFKVMLLNKANKVLGICTLTSGGVAGTVADPKLVFTTALKANASNVIVAHNHPSGNLQPSNADEDITKKIKEAGNFLDLHLLDHLIITAEGYFSFADKGLL